MPDFFSRKRPVAGVLDSGDLPTVVFLTVCTKNRRKWLADPEVHQTLRRVWRAADRWRVGPYTIMPDHLHLFACPGEQADRFDNWVHYWKSQVSRNLRDPLQAWQKASFHHRIRSYEGAEDRFMYVRMNPVRAGLVKSPEEWEFRGEIFRMKYWW